MQHTNVHRAVLGLLLCSIVLAACATQPRAEAPAARQEAPAPIAVAATPAPAPVQAATTPPVAPPAEPPAAPDPAPAAQATAAPVPAATPDLFVRLRAGFQLEDADEPSVVREVSWFANHPDYLDRVWARAGLYLHYIVEQLDERHMPREIALLPVVESAFEPYAYSRARASGLWQFIPGTGSRYGLKQDWWYDGRRDVVASTRAALDYLQALHDEFDGDWLLAIAAYNCGELNVERALKRNRAEGKPTDFWHLRLPGETRAYVPKLLAMRRIVSEPAAYGLEFSQIPDSPYFAIVHTGGQVDLQVVAEVAGVSRDELYELNPAFHRFATDPTGPYELLVPIDVADGLEATLQSLTPEQRMKVQRYEVRRGDTLNAIAARFSSTPEMLRELNGLARTDKPDVGQQLMVPTADVRLPAKAQRAALLVDGRRGAGRAGRQHVRRSAVHVVKRGDTLYAIARRTGTDVHTLARINNLPVGASLKAGQKLVVGERDAAPAPAAPSKATKAAANKGRPVTYVVRPGDTVYSISRFLQVSVQELVGWNGLGDSAAIHPGQKLKAFVF